MTRRMLTLALFAASLAAQTSTRDQRWSDDLAAYFNNLRARHPFLRNTTPNGWDADIAALRARVSSLNDTQILVEANRITASLGDAHTYIYYVAQNGFRFLPLRLRWLADGFYVTNAGGRALPLLGQKVRSIASTPVDEVFTRARAVLPHENLSWARQQVPALMISPDVLFALGLIPAADAAVRVELANGQALDLGIENVALTAFPRKARTVWPLNERSPNLEYWFDWLADSRTLYVKYNICREDPALPIATFASALIDAAGENKPERIVFDFRHNTGGSDAPFRDLMNRLGEALVTGRYAYPPKGAFAIIGRQTFSSGLSAAFDLMQNGVMLVGEPTGGKPSAPGNVVGFVFPNTRILSQFSTTPFVRKGFESVESLMPDAAVDPTIDDVAAERDPFLERILTLTAPSPQRPQR